MLDAEEWGAYVGAVVQLLLEEGAFYRMMEGHGVDINGQLEENMTFLGSYPEDGLGYLKDQLDHLRKVNGQAVVLFFAGPMEVIG